MLEIVVNWNLVCNNNFCNNVIVTVQNRQICHFLSIVLQKCIILRWLT